MNGNLERAAFAAGELCAGRLTISSVGRGRTVTADNSSAPKSDIFRCLGQGRRAWKILSTARTGGDRQPDGDPPQSRHALLVGGVRSRCRARDDHAAGCGQAVHVDAGDQRGSLCASGVLWCRQAHALRRKMSARATSWSQSALSSIRPTQRCRSGPRLTGCDQVSAKGPRAICGPQLGSIKPEEGPRCAASVGIKPAGYKAHVRTEGTRRSHTSSHRLCIRLGWQSRDEALYLNVTPDRTTARPSTN